MTSVCVKTYSTRLEAEYAKSLLESNGIPAYILIDDAGGAYPFPLSTSSAGARLLIAKNDVVRARKLLV